MPALRSRRRLGAALQRAVGGRLELTAGAEEHAPGAGLLASEARARIFQALLDRPLTHVAGLARACGAGAPSVRWHLKILRDAGLLQGLQGGREVRYFVAGSVEHESREALLALRAPLVLPLLDAVLRSPGRSVRELAGELEVSPQAVLRAKARLERLGFIESLKDGKFTRTYPADGVARFLARRSGGLPASYARVSAALAGAGESASVLRRGRDEVVFQVGRRGTRREFHLRAQGPILPDRKR